MKLFTPLLISSRRFSAKYLPKNPNFFQAVFLIYFKVGVGVRPALRNYKGGGRGATKSKKARNTWSDFKMEKINWKMNTLSRDETVSWFVPNLGLSGVGQTKQCSVASGWDYTVLKFVGGSWPRSRRAGRVGARAVPCVASLRFKVRALIHMLSWPRIQDANMEHS